MIRLIKWIFILCFIAGMLLGMLVASSIEKAATVEAPVELTADEVKRVKHFIKSNNPLNVKSGEIVSKQISQQDLDVLLNYITLKTTRRINRQVRTKVELMHQQAGLELSLRIPETLLGEYINISAQFSGKDVDENNPVKLESLKIGQLRLPVFLTSLLKGKINAVIEARFPEYATIRQSIKRIHFEQGSLKVDYVWTEQADRSIKAQIGLRMLSSELQRALMAHAEYLASESQQFPEKLRLNALINIMFSYAKQRSEKNNPVIENKAAFIAMGAYTLKHNIVKSMGEKPLISTKFKRIYLKGRHDLSKHFVLSAAIASMADTEVAESMGVDKEVRDAKMGSGFSFIDLAADHAGIRLVKESTESEQKARNFQILLSEVETETDYMLDVTNLPDGLEIRQFEENYAGTKREAYMRLEKLIKDRINALAIYNHNELKQI